MKNIIKVGKRVISEHSSCFIVAEIGINHNGSIVLAKKMIMAAKKCGADAVKFQNYNTEDFLEGEKLKYSYKMADRKVIESQFDMFKRYELSFKQIERLKRYCDKIGIIFFSTPSSEKGVVELKQLDVKLLKNSSDNIDNFKLIKSMARSSIPLVLSTGMATMSEIESAIGVFKKAGGKKIIILYCVSLYPTSPEEMNLLKISYYINTFKCLVGFSDHTEGFFAAMGAVALGACFIEKHFTIDKNLPGPDHRFSVGPDEFKNLISGVKYIEKCLGQKNAKLSKSEKKARKDFRLSCVAAVDIKKGSFLDRNQISFKRPGHGILAGKAGLLLGKRAKRFLPKATFIKFDDVW